MWKQLYSAAILLLILTVLTGLVYPLAMTGLAQTLLPFQSNGSLLTKAGTPVGSLLIGQNFSNPAYFHGRPSAAGQSGYDAASSGGSNLGPTNKKLVAAIVGNLKTVRAENNLNQAVAVPADLVTASGSGLDPDISPAAAYLQVDRVAHARGLPKAVVLALLNGHIQDRQLGIFGEPRVNVLELNLALDAQK